MIFYKKRTQAAKIWDKNKGDNGAVSIAFKKQTRDEFGMDGNYETEDKKEIKLLKKMGYEFDEPESDIEIPEV